MRAGTSLSQRRCQTATETYNRRRNLAIPGTRETGGRVLSLKTEDDLQGELKLMLQSWSAQSQDTGPNLQAKREQGKKKKRCMIINSYCWQKGSTLLCTRLHIPGCSFSFKDGSEGTTSAWTNAKSASINFHFCFPTSKLTGLIPPKCA